MGGEVKKIFSFLSLLLVFLFFMTVCSPDKKKKGKNIIVKGFSLGMDLAAAKNQVRKLFEEAGVTLNEITERKMGLDGSVQVVIQRERDGMSLIGLSANKDRRLTRISFDPITLDLFFGTRGLDNDAIAEKVMSEYDLPELVRDESGKWQHREVESVSLKLQITVNFRYFTIEGFVF